VNGPIAELAPPRRDRLKGTPNPDDRRPVFGRADPAAMASIVSSHHPRRVSHGTHSTSSRRCGDVCQPAGSRRRNVNDGSPPDIQEALVGRLGVSGHDEDWQPEISMRGRPARWLRDGEEVPARWTAIQATTSDRTGRVGTRTQTTGLRRVESGGQIHASGGGRWDVPEDELHLLPKLDGLDAIELGCGTGYVSSWLARRGAHPVGLDHSCRAMLSDLRSVTHRSISR
jgi:hypothetical protein